jgi:hypothetical protein
MEKGTCCNGKISSIVLYTQAAETACHLEISFQNKGWTIREKTERIFLGKTKIEIRNEAKELEGCWFSSMWRRSYYFSISGKKELLFLQQHGKEAIIFS